MENKETIKRRLAAAENMAVRQRNYRRGRDRALARLGQKYREEYLELLAEEKEKDVAQGKRWIDLSSNLPDNRLVPTNRTEHTDRRDTSTNPQDESDNE